VSGHHVLELWAPQEEVAAGLKLVACVRFRPENREAAAGTFNGGVGSFDTGVGDAGKRGAKQTRWRFP
jgi:hypothetical protein